MRAILFDLDNTLYGSERALFSLIDVRINYYMHHMVGIAAEDVDILRRRYWRQYGVTLQGLIREYAVDPEDYLNYVHDIDVSSRLQHNLPLRTMLQELPQRKFVFTNGSYDHACRVLNCLNIDDCFEHIFDIRCGDYIPKPNRKPYDVVLNSTGLTGERCVMVEDSLDNLETAAQLGMKTILVRTCAAGVPVSDKSSEHAFATAVDGKQLDAVVDCVEQVGSVIQGWMEK
ncbi:MAG: pyrimidine 5'-nucleotidase [Desulfobacteraceae bacterium 4572_35.1]|nr:MAG: pyrimidine 5'-nucleotidase [Desulfobacteraceae bacterium 4572_35.1]